MKQVTLIFLLSCTAVAQVGRYDSPGALTTATIGGVPGIVKVVPNASVRICTYSLGPTVPCPVLATTYTDATGSTACSVLSQVVLAGTNTCTATTDSLGNFGFWAPPGQYICQLVSSGVISTSTVCSPSGSPFVTFAVESFGAVGDWNGSTGTDNTTAINSCIAAVAAAKGGTCTLLAKAYKITAPLTITSNNVSLSGATTCTTNSAAFTAPPT